MNSLIMNFDNTAEVNAAYIRLKKLYPKVEIIKHQNFSDNIMIDTHTPDGKPKRKFATRDEYLKFLDDLCGSIDDPTMVEPEEIKYESFREQII